MYKNLSTFRTKYKVIEQKLIHSENKIRDLKDHIYIQNKISDLQELINFQSKIRDLHECIHKQNKIRDQARTYP